MTAPGHVSVLPIIREDKFEQVVNNKRAHERKSKVSKVINDPAMPCNDQIDNVFSDDVNNEMFITQRTPPKGIKRNLSSSSTGSLSGLSFNNVSAVSDVNDINEKNDNVINEPLGQQNPWAVQYPARLWELGAKNSSYLVKEAEMRVMRRADFTKKTLMGVFNGFSNINPNDFVGNVHRSIACAGYYVKVGDESVFRYFSSSPKNPDGCFMVSSANSSNVAVITA